MTSPTPDTDPPEFADKDGPDDYDSPWKEAVERYFPEFMAFYFPAAHAQIDWAGGYEFLDQELRAVVQDAELGKRFVDKLVRVRRLTGEEDWIYIHVEVQGRAQPGFAERMFIYNYRLYDRFHRPVASMAVLADNAEHWHPDRFGFEVLGCRHVLTFPTVKLLAYAGREDALQSAENPFALVTLAHLLTRQTRQDMQARFTAKWKLVQLLYRRGWDRQRVIDLFVVLDWMMHLPKGLTQQLRQNIDSFEEQEKMRYVTSIERLGIEQGIEQGIELGMEKGMEQGMERGMQRSKADSLTRLLTKRFGPLTAEVTAQIEVAPLPQLEAWFDRAIDGPSVEAVFGQTPH